MVIKYYIMDVSTTTLLFKVIPGYMFRLDLVIYRPILTFVLPDTVHTLRSDRVYIRGMHLVTTLVYRIVYRIGERRKVS